MLPGAGFGDNALFAHVFRQQSFAHTVIQLMRAGVVQIFAFQVDLAMADFLRKPLAVIDWRRTALELPADAPQFLDKFRGVANSQIIVGDFFKGRDELFGKIRPAVFSKTALGVWILLEIR